MSSHMALKCLRLSSAAREHVESGRNGSQKAWVLAALRQFPGVTSLELGSFANINRHFVARRLPDLERIGLVVRGPARTCAIGRRLAVTWRLA